MQFEKIQNNGPKVPELVMDSLLKAMEAGTIRVGEELPPERNLAEALGISQPSVSGRLKRGRERLRDILEGRKNDA